MMHSYTAVWMQETQKRSKHLLMINFVLITTILVLMPMPITISNVNAGGPRLDYDERYEDVPGAPVTRTAKMVILLIMIKTVDVLSTAIHTKLDSRQAVNQ